MTMSIQVFAALLTVGLLLFGAEVFVPGGILGTIGAIALVGAIVTGFYAFPGYGGPIAIGIILLAGLAVVLWIRIFPKSGIGRNMTVSIDLAEAKAAPAMLKELMGKEGTASSDLRPGGMAVIDGRRIDVITQGEMISKGQAVRVVRVEGTRVVVTGRKPEPATASNG